MSFGGMLTPRGVSVTELAEFFLSRYGRDNMWSRGGRGMAKNNRIATNRHGWE